MLGIALPTLIMLELRGLQVKNNTEKVEYFFIVVRTIQCILYNTLGSIMVYNSPLVLQKAVVKNLLNYLHAMLFVV